MILSGTQSWGFGFSVEHSYVFALGPWISIFRVLCLSLEISQLICNHEFVLCAVCAGSSLQCCNVIDSLSLSCCSTHQVLLEERALVRRAGCGGQPS